MVEFPVIIWSLDVKDGKWTDMRQSKVQRRDFVVAVMNIHVPKRLEQLINYFTFRDCVHVTVLVA